LAIFTDYLINQLINQSILFLYN